MAKSFRELLVWQRAMSLAEDVYRITEDFPKREMFGLAAQMRRAAVSIASNIAEGSSRGTRKDFRQFVAIARGSNNELQTQLELAVRIGLLPQEKAEQADALTHEIGRVLLRLSEYLGSTK